MNVDGENRVPIELRLRRETALAVSRSGGYTGMSGRRVCCRGTMSRVEGSPETRYTTGGEGAYIAYQVTGGAPPHLLVMSGEFVPVDAMHEEPRYSACLDRLASFSRVIRFDQRGTGLSEPVSSSAPTTVEDWVADAISVLDAVGAERATVFASTDAGLAGLVLAATHP